MRFPTTSPNGTHFQQVLRLRHLLTPAGLSAVCRLLAGEHLESCNGGVSATAQRPHCNGATARPRLAGPTRASCPGNTECTTTTVRTFHRPASSPHLRVVSSTLGDDGGGVLLPMLLLLPMSPPPGASARQLSVPGRGAGRATLRQVRVAGRQVRYKRGAEAAGHVQTRGSACMMAM